MDLLDIRKKAKGLKEAGEAAAQEAAQEAAMAAAPEAEVAEGPPEAAVETPVPKPAKQAVPVQPRVKKRRKKAEKPAPELEAVAGLDDAAPDDVTAVPGLMDALADALVEEVAAVPPPPPEAPVAAAQDLPVPPVPATVDGSGWDDDGPGDLSEVVEYLAFRLASEEYAVKVEDVKEIIRLQRITQVPRAPEFVLGIISLRGVIIPVFDIKKRLGLEATERTRSTRIVVLSEKGAPQGIIVDKVTGVARLEASGIEPPPAVIGGVEGEFIEGIGRLDGRLLILFNTGRVLEMEG